MPVAMTCVEEKREKQKIKKESEICVHSWVFTLEMTSWIRYWADSSSLESEKKEDQKQGLNLILSWSQQSYVTAIFTVFWFVRETSELCVFFIAI